MKIPSLTIEFAKYMPNQLMISGRTPGFKNRPMSTEAIPTEPPLPPPSLVQSIVTPGDRPEVVLKGAWYPERPGENDGF